MVLARSLSPHHPPPSKKIKTLLGSPLHRQQAPKEPSRHFAAGSVRLTFEYSMSAEQIQTRNRVAIINLIKSIAYHQSLIMQKEEKIKGNKFDLIFNFSHPIHDEQGLKNEYFEGGSVYLGTKDAVSAEVVYAQQIGAVLTIMDRKSYEKEGIAKKIGELGLTEHHLYIEAKDSKEEKIVAFFPAVKQFLEKAEKQELNVLVHCKGGMSRSPAFLCSFIMTRFGLPYQQAKQLLQERRSVVCINQGFEKQLKEHEKVKK